MSRILADTFIGNQCTHGHILRYVSDRKCVECRQRQIKEAGERWRRKNGENVRAERARVLGYSGSYKMPEYRAWCGAKGRCHSATNKGDYALLDYPGRP